MNYGEGPVDRIEGKQGDQTGGCRSCPGRAGAGWLGLKDRTGRDGERRSSLVCICFEEPAGLDNGV